MVISNSVTLETKSLKDQLAHISLDEMDHFVALLDTKGVLLAINRAALKITGLEHSEIIGKVFYESFRKRVSAATQQNVIKAVTDDYTTTESIRFDVEIFSQMAGQKSLLIDFSIKRINDQNGNAIYYLAEGHDITAKRIREREIAHMLMQGPLGICILEGPNHIFKLVNDTYLKILFEQKRDIIEKSFSEAFPELQGKEVEKRLNEVYQNGIPYTGTEILLQINQKNKLIKKLYVDFTYHPVRTTSENIKGVLVVITDVTEKVNARKKLEESEQRYRSLTDTIPQLMWGASPDGEVNYVNERCSQYTGLSIEAYASGWVDKIHTEDQSAVKNAWLHSIKAGTEFVQEYRMFRHDRASRWFLGRALPVKNKEDKILYWIGTATDIEDQKKIVAELEEAKEVAEHANATKSAFLANMSHEIRTPLAAILGYSDLLKDTDLSISDRDHYIGTISRNGQSLTRIIDDILDLAKVEAGRLDVEEIDFPFIDLLSEVSELFSEKAKHKGIYLTLKIDHNIPNYISTDPTRLRQILINIIGNAVKFTETGGVMITAKMIQDIEGALRLAIYVNDTGPGLTEEQKGRLFKPFSQGDNTMTRQFGGTGLGLVLSQRLSQALGGGIHIENCSPGIGCTFVISFVATLSKVNREKTVNLNKTVLKNSDQKALLDIKVLLVDDSVDNQYLVKRLLTKNGALVDIASDGAQAVEKASSGDFDIILMDIQMPVMDGYQAIKILKLQDYKKPIIALTAHAMLEEQLKTKNAGFAGHLTKPIDISQMVNSIRSLTQLQ